MCSKWGLCGGCAGISKLGDPSSSAGGPVSPSQWDPLVIHLLPPSKRADRSEGCNALGLHWVDTVA